MTGRVALLWAALLLATSCAAPVAQSPTAAPAATAQTATSAPAATSAIYLPGVAGNQTGSAPPVATYQVIKSYPHDRAAFTEGLVYDHGALYEGTGMNGASWLRRVDLATGAVQQQIAIDQQYFGEGITILGDTIYQLTWQSHIGFAYDRASFKRLRDFRYPTEGWGLTNDGARLIMSDGTPTLHFLDPQTLAETGRVTVADDHGPVERLNELEFVRGEVLANVWQTDRIARIDPASGRVLGWIDLSGLLGPADRAQPVDVLNGIAYDPAGDRLFVTGKYWPKLFEIKLVGGR